MSLIEMLVALAILSGIILGYSVILSQSQKVVKHSQALMRANATANAIEQIIRSDLRTASKLGFLAVRKNCTFQAGSNLYTVLHKDGLVLVTAGVTWSRTGNAVGTGALVTYGLCANNAPGSSTDDYILYRQGWVLTEDGATTGFDKWNIDMARLQTLQTADIDTIITNLFNLDTVANGNKPTNLSVPPTTLDHVTDAWQVLAIDCKSLEIRYFSNNQWREPGNDCSTEATRRWTKENQNDWPSAIKFRFVLSDRSLPEEVRDKVFEIICPVSK